MPELPDPHECLQPILQTLRETGAAVNLPGSCLSLGGERKFAEERVSVKFHQRGISADQGARNRQADHADQAQYCLVVHQMQAHVQHAR